MRRTPRAERVNDPDWGMLIRAELNSYHPHRLPARSSPRTHSRQASSPAWRSLAIGFAAALLGVLAVAAIERPAGITGAWHQLAGVHSPATPSQVATPTKVPAPATPAHGRSTVSSSALHRPESVQSRPRPSQAMASPVGSTRGSASPIPTDEGSSSQGSTTSSGSRLVPQLLPTPPPTSTSTAPSSSSSKGSCLPVLSLLCK